MAESDHKMICLVVKMLLSDHNASPDEHFPSYLHHLLRYVHTYSLSVANVSGLLSHFVTFSNRKDSGPVAMLKNDIITLRLFYD